MVCIYIIKTFNCSQDSIKTGFNTKAAKGDSFLEEFNLDTFTVKESLTLGGEHLVTQCSEF